jgi:hypothetical protein
MWTLDWTIQIKNRFGWRSTKIAFDIKGNENPIAHDKACPDI